MSSAEATTQCVQWLGLSACCAPATRRGYCAAALAHAVPVTESLEQLVLALGACGEDNLMSLKWGLFRAHGMEMWLAEVHPPAAI